MLRDQRKLHRDRLGETLIAQPGRRDDHHAAAATAFNLRIETVADQIGDSVETLASINAVEHYKNAFVNRSAGKSLAARRLPTSGRDRALFRLVRLCPIFAGLNAPVASPSP